MKEKVKNPDAFPYQWDSRHNPESITTPGMTLRDYFAAKAMQSILIASFQHGAYFDGRAKATGKEVIDILSEMAYQQADAMLMERERGGDE